MLTSFTALRKKYPHARLIIAPRKLNRIEEIKKVNAKFGYEMGFRSKLKEMEGSRPEFPVLMLDTIGELGRIYAIGDIVFVGGSLVRILYLSVAAWCVTAATMYWNRRLMPNPFWWAPAWKILKTRTPC